MLGSESEQFTHEVPSLGAEALVQPHARLLRLGHLNSDRAVPQRLVPALGVPGQHPPQQAATRQVPVVAVHRLSACAHVHCQGPQLPHVHTHAAVLPAQRSLAVPVEVHLRDQLWRAVWFLPHWVLARPAQLEGAL